MPLFDKNGAVRGMNIDITERKEAEQALRESDRRKDEFLAILGHELRNPLAAMRNGIELIENASSRSDNSSGSRALRVLDRQSRHMTRLVNDLLDVTREPRSKCSGTEPDSRARTTPVVLSSSMIDVALGSIFASARVACCSRKWISMSKRRLS